MIGQNGSCGAHIGGARAISIYHGGLVVDLEWKQIGIVLHYPGKDLPCYDAPSGSERQAMQGVQEHPM